MKRNEAIEIVREYYPSSGEDLNEALETLIPELKEGEDERIRKALLNAFQESEDSLYMVLTPHRRESFIAWLEKQGSQQLANSAKTCKDESKFKVGDWVIVHNKDAYQVIEVNIYDYRLKHFLGGEMLFPFTQESSLKLWDIQDAKAGDILMANAPFIFNGNLDGGIDCPGAYCAINTLGKFQIPEHPTHWTGHSVTPATKEQRDLLFQKMKEADYEWDAEKKELKKIEQKPAWSEDENPF